MKKGILAMLILMLSLFIIPLSSAELQYFQNKLFIGNDTINEYQTIKYSAYLHYDKSVDDYVKKNNPLEVYVEYRAYLNKWNSATNSSLDVTYCNLTIFSLPSNAPTSYVAFERTFYPNESDTDLTSNKYFIQLQDNDAVRTEINCRFLAKQSLNPTYDLDIPVDFSYVTPTWSCKACQFYEWARQQVTINKALTLEDNTSTNLHYIWRLLSINLEILIILFWIFTFIIFYVVVSMLFMGVYWVYTYLRSLAQ